MHADAQSPLTPRELEVLELVASGLRSRVIARELGVTEATVNRHLSNIYRRLGVRNRVEATNWFLTQETTHPPR